MYRSLAIVLALFLTTISIAATGFAAEVGSLSFEVSEAGNDRLQLALRSGPAGSRASSSSFPLREFAGFNRASLRGQNNAPVRFALVREAGRLDCVGRTQGPRARGTCRFVGEPSFAAFLVESGIARPDQEELLDLAVVGTPRSLVRELKEGGFVMPTPKTLVGMTAVGVSAAYVRDMAAEGYRPRRTADFIPLKALDVSSTYIRSLRSLGYDRLPVDQLIQLKALGVTAEFIGSFQRRGYRNLSVARLVQLKALGIRPEDLNRQVTERPWSLSRPPLGLLNGRDLPA